MNQHQQNPRSAADRAFVESLNQLQKTLQPAAKQSAQPVVPVNDDHTSTDPDPFDLSSFEQAVADIEAFIETRQQQNGER